MIPSVQVDFFKGQFLYVKFWWKGNPDILSKKPRTVTLSSTSPGIGYHFGAIPTAVAVATGPVTMTTNTVMAPNTVTLPPKVVTVAPVAAPVTVAPNPVKAAPNSAMVAPNPVTAAPNCVGVQPTSSQPVPRASAPPTSLHLDFTKMTREQLNLYDDIPAPNAELAELLGRISRVRDGYVIHDTCKELQRQAKMFVNSWHRSLLNLDWHPD